jgi:hypothetical protein
MRRELARFCEPVQFLPHVAIKRPRPRWREKLTAVRHRFVLTSEEKKVIVFVLAAFVLGLGAKYYRERHPQPPVKIDAKHARVQRLSPSPSP